MNGLRIWRHFTGGRHEVHKCDRQKTSHCSIAGCIALTATYEEEYYRIVRTAKQQLARDEMASRLKLYWAEKPPIERVRHHLEKLEQRTVSITDRMVFWRLIADAALQAHEQEVQLLDSLNSIKSDPSCEVPIAT